MKIRKATLADSAYIAPILLMAMEDIVYTFIGEKNPEKAEAFLLNFLKRENNQYSYQNCIVAEVGTEIVAAINFYDGSKLEALRKPVLEYIWQHFDTILHLEEETQAGEYYIDSIGVSQSHRGQGIGSKLLQFLIDEYVNKKGKSLGLLVDEENPKAKRLYLKLGFKSTGKKVFVGKRYEHLQIN